MVGLPRSLSGRDGPAARAVREEVEALRVVAAAAGTTVELHDERFTTVVATRRRRAAGTSRRRAAGTSRRRGEPVDAAAAAVLLESYLVSVARAPAVGEPS